MRQRIFVAAFIMLVAAVSYGYRFICNGVLANGEERTDDSAECGVCDAQHAARWSNPSIEVIVDYSKTPRNISESDWRSIVQKSFAAWENVSGSSLRFVERDDKNPRAFGANDRVHEIFWITDRQEWRKLVGSGEFGTLGATLPRYECDGQGSREIYDA